jgi:hypothetical protein
VGKKGVREGGVHRVDGRAVSAGVSLSSAPDGTIYVVDIYRGVIQHKGFITASVLTYVRRKWGHTASPVDPSTVAATRKATADRMRPWTNDELTKLLGGG